MKATLTSVFLVLFAGAALAQAPQADVATLEAPFYTGISDAASLRTIVEQRLSRMDGHLKTLLDVQGPRTIDNTLVPYDRMGMEIEGASRLAMVVARLHPDERMRTTADELLKTVVERFAALTLRPDIYSALRATDLGSTDPATRRYVTRELRDLELAGVNKSEDVRARLTQLQTELQAAQQEFSRNLLNGQRRISASASEIEGLPQDFITARKPDASGSITLTTDDVDMQVVSTYARNPALRKRHLIERFNVAAPGNVNVLERLLAIRYEIATLLGYPMWAEYHALGHVIHAIVGGQGRWHGINGIDIEGDVAEAPSTMLEEWIWDVPTLATFARHYQTNEPIPADLVKQMRQAGEFGTGLDSQRQAFLSKVSLSLHDKTQSVVDSTAVVRDVSLKYNSLYPWVHGTYFQAQFTHLSNGLYTSSYYTYLWSRVVAKDLFSQFDRTNLLAPSVAQRYRDTILVPGGSKPATDLIGDFLGRPFRFDAYERWLNGEGASATN
jgi:Zn-dependent oligopeptidase